MAMRGVPTPRARKGMVVSIWKLGIWDPTDSASIRAISKRDSDTSMRSPVGTLKSKSCVPSVRARSSSRFSNLAARTNMMYVSPSVGCPWVTAPRVMMRGGTPMAMVRAWPPRPRCKAAAC
eukprot:8790140-Pyramimonas_sp.AAC.1